MIGSSDIELARAVFANMFHICCNTYHSHTKWFEHVLKLNRHPIVRLFPLLRHLVSNVCALFTSMQLCWLANSWNYTKFDNLKLHQHPHQHHSNCLNKLILAAFITHLVVQRATALAAFLICGYFESFRMQESKWVNFIWWMQFSVLK